MKLVGNTKAKHSKAAAASPVRARAKKRGGARTAAYIIGAVLGLLLLAVGIYMLWEKAPSHQTGGLTQQTAQTTPTPAQDDGAPTPAASPSDEPTTGRNENMFTFLICGRDKVGANTDTMMVGSINTDTHEINVVSIPRDTLVNISESVKKVNTLYAYDLVSGGNGIDGLLDGIEDLLGFRVDCYAVVNLSAVEQMVDAIGGVNYDVPLDMYYEDPDQDLHINISAGYQHLTGAQAVQVLRFRAGYASADIGRIGTQQDFLMSVAKQMISLGNIPNLTKLISVFTSNVETDLTADNLSFLARQFLLCSSDDIHFYTLNGDYGCNIKGLSYVSLYLDEWIKLVNDVLNPWYDDVTEANVNILRCSGGVFYSTVGYVAGGEDSFYDATAHYTAAPEPDTAPDDGDGGDAGEDAGGTDAPTETAAAENTTAPAESTEQTVEG